MDPVEGWTVYNFFEAEHGGDPSHPAWLTSTIDINDEQDFPTYEEAAAEAARRADLFDVEVREY